MTLGSHQRTVGKSQTHLTPPWLIARLNEFVSFDLDPCAAPPPRPFTYAVHNWSEGGLDREWFGNVYMNSPFDRYQVEKWVRKFVAHGQGIGLVHARTETGWFQPLWESEAPILFLNDRIKFYDMAGIEQPANSGAPVVLFALGDDNVRAIKSLDGWLIKDRERTLPAHPEAG